MAKAAQAPDAATKAGFEACARAWRRLAEMAQAQELLQPLLDEPRSFAAGPSQPDAVGDPAGPLH